MKRSAFDQLIRQRVLIGDGAMGTMLYQHGVFLNRCFDELNLTDPGLVKKIHASYIEAGVDLIETNTFGANRLKLSKSGLAGDMAQINRAGVRLAREAAKDSILVAGSMGPLGGDLVGHGPITSHEAQQVFEEQGGALVEAGVDLLILETFSNTEELLIAIRAVAGLGDVPVVAQMTVGENQETIYGERIDHAISRIAQEPAVAAVGLNCSVGPSGMLSSLELVCRVTDKPISVQPNAGMPRRVEGRQLYMCTPEYMAEYAKRFFEMGARIIGGCCGTTPEHIKEIVRAVRSVSKAMAQSAVPAVAEVQRAAKPVLRDLQPLEARSRFGAKLAAGESVTMVEITPPRGVDVTGVVEKARQCAAAGVDAINIPDGPRASSRLSPLVTAVRIQEGAGIEAILHFCCRDRNLIGMQSDILGASAIGVRNLLIITGAPPKLGEYPSATGVFDMDSITLTTVVRNLNRGVDIGGNTIEPSTSLVVGVGANPVAADLEREIDRFRQKVLAGAEFAITQPVFDADCLFRFLETIEGSRIPIIAGIWPFTSFKNAEFMANEVPGVVVPKVLLDRMSKATTKEHGRALGIEIAQELVAKIKDAVAGFAVSAPFGNVGIALAVLGKVDVGVV
ncbi:MAG: bifunctional homocysteine S-methyltransferase/methylenetetrahydrofolate reductase [Phycisphaerae bacterium]|nr:bifunctional homocysteine S-methyltransferase/methylenetetrahydrofolate reductase [Phycisphaerae bacterium]